MCLGFETFFGSPGVGPGTLASRVGVGVEIPLLCATQVSGLLDTLDVYYTDINEGE